MAIVTKSGSRTKPREVIERAKAEGVEVVDVRFIDLPGREFALLEYFLRHENTVLTRSRIIEEVWDWAFDGGRMFVAEDGGRLVGHFGFAARRFRIAGHEVDALLGIDVMIEPDMRRTASAISSVIAQRRWRMTSKFALPPQIRDRIRR